MRSILFTFLFLSFAITGCNQRPNEDLVLIEFAAKLEEDYHKMHPIEGPGKSHPVRQVDVDGRPLNENPITPHGEHRE